MEAKYAVSIIIPAYNAEETIKDCLDKILLESKNLESEIIVIDDKSTDNTCEIIKKFKSIKLIALKKNRGVGYARNLGAKIASHNILCYIDSDLIISKNSIFLLVDKLNQDNDYGSVGAIQETHNLNSKSWSSNFVCLKSCYGFESAGNEILFSAINSEFCVISKELLKKVGGWRFYRNAGGEEFDLGHKIRQLNKKNILIKGASYRTYWASLFLRFKKVIDRTEKYIGVFLNKKEFDSSGSFATSGQALSSFLTLSIYILSLSYLFIDKWPLVNAVLLLFFIQIIIEFKFMVFAYKYFGLKMLFFSLFGIQVINTGILLGAVFFILGKIRSFIFFSTK
jgi:glycosyltransferase involved in cell wall biosynthesis